MRNKSRERDILDNLARWEERPFLSPIPLFGPLFALVRSAWLRLAERDFILPIQQQQNRFNQQLLRTLRHQDDQLISQDRAATEMRPALDDLLRETRRLQQQIDRLDGRFPQQPS